MNEETEYLFCSATKRPKYCLKENNTCCVNCDELKKCLFLANKHNYKLKPCTKETIGEEQCEFMI